MSPFGDFFCVLLVCYHLFVYFCTLNHTNFRNRYEYASKCGSLVFLEAGATVLGNPVAGLLDGGDGFHLGGCTGGRTGGCHDELEDAGDIDRGLSVVLLHWFPYDAYVLGHYPIFYIRGLTACGFREYHWVGA